MQRFVLFLCLCVGIAACQQQQRRVWLDANPSVNTTIGQVVTVRFSGYEEYEWCKVVFVDPYFEAALMGTDKLGACDKGYIRFKLVDLSPNYEFIVTAGAIIPGTSYYGAISTNHTVYYQTPPDNEYYLYKKEEIKERAAINYYGEEYKPPGCGVWLSDNITVLGVDATVTVDFVGIEEYGSSYQGFIVADNGINNINFEGNTWDDYIRFKKVCMPSSRTAYLVIAVMDDDTGLPLFHFTSENSFRMDVDSTFKKAMHMRDQRIQQEEEKLKRAGRGGSLNYRPLRYFDIVQRTAELFEIQREANYFKEVQRKAHVRDKYLDYMFGR